MQKQQTITKLLPFASLQTRPTVLVVVSTRTCCSSFQSAKLDANLDFLIPLEGKLLQGRIISCSFFFDFPVWRSLHDRTSLLAVSKVLAWQPKAKAPIVLCRSDCIVVDSGWQGTCLSVILVIYPCSTIGAAWNNQLSQMHVVVQIGRRLRIELPLLLPSRPGFWFSASSWSCKRICKLGVKRQPGSVARQLAIRGGRRSYLPELDINAFPLQARVQDLNSSIPMALG